MARATFVKEHCCANNANHFLLKSFGNNVEHCMCLKSKLSFNDMLLFCNTNFFLLFLLMFTNCSCPNCNPWIFCGEPTSWAYTFVVKQSSKAKINVPLLSPVHVVLSQVQVKYKYICSYNYQTNGSCQTFLNHRQQEENLLCIYLFLIVIKYQRLCSQLNVNPTVGMVP